MHFKHKKSILCITALSLGLFLSACGESGASAPTAQATPAANVNVSARETNHSFLVPETGTETIGNDLVTIDISKISEGYLMIKYAGDADKSAIQISVPDGETTYTYFIKDHEYQTFPLSSGDGKYELVFSEHISDSKYATVFSDVIDVELADEFRPYLYPNQYAWYTKDSEAVKLGIEFSDESTDDLEYIGHVYDYVISNITYDDEKAAQSPTGYISDVDETLSTKKGICLDYAALMTAMLRSQSIPTKLVFGYSGTAYHAWISVYLEEIGWVDNIIEFDGSSWSLMDPTLAANNNANAVKQYIGDGTNYTVKYLY